MLKNLKIPRLGLNRLGVFFVRYPSVLDDQGRRRVVQQSLRTKDPATAKLLALRFCLDLATGEKPMSSSDPRLASTYNVNLSTGDASADGPEDHERMMAFLSTHKDLFLTLAKLRADSVQTVDADTQGRGAASTPAMAASFVANVMSLEEAFRLHLDVERRAVKNEQTVNEKRAVYADFMEVFGLATPVRHITAPMITTRWTPLESTRENTKFGGTLGLRRLEKRRLYLSKRPEPHGCEDRYQEPNR
jgi:hypothetical protein